MQAKIVNSDSPLPEELRLALNLRPGQAYTVIPRRKSVVLVPVPTLEEIAGIAEGADTEGYRDRRP
ncbi:AbrB/MazE/SpoVT family DNA-binding domain-containing protein [Myxococcota bacterium]|nr:AbrB/MazE/SpoVT family DNA-binding domain-containing protein [Myxococcota bacterium]